MVISHGHWHSTGKRALNAFCGVKQWPRKAHAHATIRLPRFPFAWNPAIEQEPLNINKSQQILMRNRIYPISKYRKRRSTLCDDLLYRGAFFAKMRCSVRRCMLRRRAVSETLRPQSS